MSYQQAPQQVKIQRVVKSAIHSLVAQEQSGNIAHVRETLAHARRGIGRPPGSVPEIWGLTLKNVSCRKRLDEPPSPEEWAVHITITLFAMHQQSRSIVDELAHQNNQSIGLAMRALSTHNTKSPHEIDDKTKKRLDALASSKDIAGLERHVRSIVTLLKTASIRLDYPRLAVDVYDFQKTEARDQLKLRWGREFFREVSEKALAPTNTHQEKEASQ